MPKSPSLSSSFLRNLNFVQVSGLHIYQGRQDPYPAPGGKSVSEGLDSGSQTVVPTAGSSIPRQFLSLISDLLSHPRCEAQQLPITWAEREHNESTLEVNTFLGRKQSANCLPVSRESNEVPHYTDAGQTGKDQPPTDGKRNASPSPAGGRWMSKTQAVASGLGQGAGGGGEYSEVLDSPEVCDSTAPLIKQ